MKTLPSAAAPRRPRALLGAASLQGKWTLCAYLGDASEGRASAEAFAAAGAEDVRPFLRAGFKQFVECVSRGRAPIVFALPRMLEGALLPPTADLALVAPPPERKKSAASARLFEAARGADAGPGGFFGFLVAAKKLVASGASLAESCALHAVAAGGDDADTMRAKLDALLALAPGAAEADAAVNHADDDGATPLMVAAAVALGHGALGEPARTFTCEHLIARGARKDARDFKGRTARDIALAAVRDSEAFRSCFRLQTPVDAAALLALLE